MIEIILSNKQKIEVENESSKYDFVIRTDSFSEIDAYKNIITEENINGAVMEGETLSDLVFDSFATTVEIENLRLRTDFLFREKTIEERVSELETPPLTSPFTKNLEPTGIASRFYQYDELIAIYNDNKPITVKVTSPISFKQTIVIGGNCELYLGGN